MTPELLALLGSPAGGPGALLSYWAGWRAWPPLPTLCGPTTCPCLIATMTDPYRVRNSTRDLGTWPSREEILALGAELDERYDVDHGDVDLVRAAIARWGTAANTTNQEDYE